MAAPNDRSNRQRDLNMILTDVAGDSIYAETQLVTRSAVSEQVELGWRKGGNLVSERVKCVKPFSSNIWTIGIPDNIIRIYGVT